MRELKVKDLLEVVDALREKGYDVDSFKLLVSTGGVFEDPVWALQVLEDAILLEV